MTIKTDTKFFYCEAGAHLWYYDEDDADEEIPLFYANFGDATDEELENAENRYCGCNE
jgi:hypothetical protein